MVEIISGGGEMYRNAFNHGTGLRQDDFRNINFILGNRADEETESQTLQHLKSSPDHSRFDDRSYLFFDVTNPRRQDLNVLWVPVACPYLPVEKEIVRRQPVEGRTYIVETFSPSLRHPIVILVFADDEETAKRHVRSEKTRNNYGLGFNSSLIDAYPRLVSSTDFILEAKRKMESGEYLPAFIINEFAELQELRRQLNDRRDRRTPR